MLNKNYIFLIIIIIVIIMLILVLTFYKEEQFQNDQESNEELDNKQSIDIYIITMKNRMKHVHDFLDSFIHKNDNVYIVDAVMKDSIEEGCKMSHLNVLDKIIKKYEQTNEDTYNIIFEDDVISLHNNSREIVSEFIKDIINKFDKFDILYTGYCFEQYPNDTSFKTNYEGVELPIIKLSTPRCTHSYIIKSSIASKLKDMIIRSKEGPIDEIYAAYIFDKELTSYGIQLFKQPWF